MLDRFPIKERPDGTARTAAPRPSGSIDPLLHLKGFLTRLPIGGAETSGLQCLQHTQGFIDTAADVFVVDHLVANDALRIDDKQTAQGNTLIFDQHAVIAAHLVGGIRSQRELDLAQAVLFPRGVDPGPVGVFAVGADPQDVGVQVFEFLVPIAQRP